MRLLEPKHILFLFSNIENLVILITMNLNSGMKNHDIISDNISINKGKKTYKERICNQQEINLL